MEPRASGHHYEVRLGMGIIFMYNMSILEAFWGWGWWLPPPWGWPAPEDIWAELRPSGHHDEVRLGLGIIFIIICLYYRRFGLRDGG